MDFLWGSGWGSSIEKNSFVMSRTGIPIRSLFPIRFRSGAKSSGAKSSFEKENGDGNGDIFPRQGWL
jgi:hypothetical protein